jgi:hypothetical protein
MCGDSNPGATVGADDITEQEVERRHILTEVHVDAGPRIRHEAHVTRRAVRVELGDPAERGERQVGGNPGGSADQSLLDGGRRQQAPADDPAEVAVHERGERRARHRRAARSGVPLSHVLICSPAARTRRSSSGASSDDPTSSTPDGRPVPFRARASASRGSGCR